MDAWFTELYGRHIRGRCRVDAEPGTIVGPNAWGEYLVAVAHMDGITEFALATQPDIEAMLARAPQSPVEARWQAHVASHR